LTIARGPLRRRADHLAPADTEVWATTPRRRVRADRRMEGQPSSRSRYRQRTAEPSDADVDRNSVLWPESELRPTTAYRPSTAPSRLRQIRKGQNVADDDLR
jgi:hypothetical protein